MDKFAKSLALGFDNDKNADIDISPSLSLIEKKAGLTIHQPTPENIEKFVSNFVRSELKEFPKALQIRTFLNPTNISDAVRGSVSEANGNVNIKLHDKVVEIPFIIEDGELVPFDIIQMNGERALYSRENINKVLTSISNIYDNPDLSNSFNPYLGTEKKTSPATDIGFLRDVLQIRDEKGSRSTGGTHYVTASEDFDEILEKTSSISEITDEQYKNIESIFAKKALDDWESDMEKIASEDISEERSHFKMIMEGIKNLPLRNIHTMKNGQKIHFPEVNGSDMSMTPGIVMKNIIPFRSSENKYKSKAEKALQDTRETSIMVITDDGRYIVLPKEEPMFAIEVEDTWKLKTVEFTTMKEEDIYTALNGNNILFPFKAGNKSIPEIRDVSNEGAITEKIPNPNVSAFKLSVIGCEEYPSGENFSIVESSGNTFNKTTRDEFAISLESKFSPEQIALIKANLPYGDFYACDATTPVVKLTGSIKNYLRHPKELMFSGASGDNLFKEASVNSISLEVVSPERRIYDLKLQWKDNSKTIPSMKRKEFENIQEAKLQGILLAMGLLRSEVAELVEKAIANNRAVMDMPMSATPEKITGGDVEGTISRAMSNFKNTVLTKKNLENYSTAVIGEQLGGIASNSATMANLLEGASKWASESEILSIEFEKIAADKNSTSMLDVAKLMTSSYNMANAIKLACEGKDMGMFKESCILIDKKTPSLEKMAYELISLKVAQYENKDEIISPSLIHGALNNIDRMFKVAKAGI